MALLHYLWSRTAASNATADAAAPWPEGMAPSQVNDSARAMMASAAGFRDDISGAIVTTGTSTAYAVASYQVFNSLANMSGQMIAFTPHVMNGATVTLNVDGLGAKPLRSAPSAELLAGTLIQGTPYTALYNNTDGVWYLRGLFGNPYSIPLGGGLDYWAPTAPNSSFVFPIGQAISRTTYAALFALVGTTYGVGDGSTTFNLPDKRGRVSAAADGGAGRLTDLVAGFDSLGEAGGAQTHTLTTAQMPSHAHNVFITDPGHNHTSNAITGTDTTGGGGFACGDNSPATINNSTTGIIIGAFPGSNSNGTASAGSGNAHNIVQPTIVCNYIIRVI